MKGISFQNGIEYRLNLNGESWSQGEEIPLHLDAIEKNPGSLSRAQTRVLLAEGIDKKVKSKADDAFQILWEHTPHTFPHIEKIQIAIDARISDSKGSLYLLYGNGDSVGSLAFLRLNIVPQPLLMEFSASLNSHYRFVTKSITQGKNSMVHFLYTPPAAKEWASLQEMEWITRIQDSEIVAEFCFYRNEIDATKPGTKAKTVTKKFSRQWKVSEMVHSFNGRLNKDIAEAEIQKVIDEYRGQGWLA